MISYTIWDTHEKLLGYEKSLLIAYYKFLSFKLQLWNKSTNIQSISILYFMNNSIILEKYKIIYQSKYSKERKIIETEILFSITLFKVLRCNRCESISVIIEVAKVL